MSKDQGLQKEVTFWGVAASMLARHFEKVHFSYAGSFDSSRVSKLVFGRMVHRNVVQNRVLANSLHLENSTLNALYAGSKIVCFGALLAGFQRLLPSKGHFESKYPPGPCVFFTPFNTFQKDLQSFDSAKWYSWAHSATTRQATRPETCISRNFTSCKAKAGGDVGANTMSQSRCAT